MRRHALETGILAACAGLFPSMVSAQVEPAAGPGKGAPAPSAPVAAPGPLTPISPSPGDPTRPAFQLYGEIDVPVLGLGLVLFSARFLRGAPPYCGVEGAPPCDPEELSFIDRPFAGRYDRNWSQVSNVGLVGIGVASALTLALDEGPLHALNDLVVVAQSALLATSLPSLSTIAADRPRPYVYGDAAPEEARLSANASHSFISSHTSISFAVATSTFMAMNRLHRTATVPLAVLGVGLATASLVGTSRVLSGSHFPTDVLAGAVAGSAIGVLIPALHRSPVRVVPTSGESGRGVAVLVGDFGLRRAEAHD